VRYLLVIIICINNVLVCFVTGSVPLEEIPALVRSVGYYPSEEEVLNMINEVKL
jgi:Ca2+-binding EF-hand superfamily protein